MVFPTFFTLNLNFAIRNSWSQPQSSRCLVFADRIELLHLKCKEHNQSCFSIELLVISMCGAISWVVRKACLLWPGCSLDEPLFPLLCFTLYSNVKLAYYSGYVLISYFCIPMKRMSSLVLVLGIVGIHRSSQLQLRSHQWLGCRLELQWCWWSSLEMNWDHSAVFEVVSKYWILDSQGVLWGLLHFF